MTKNDKNLNNSILSIVSVTQISPIATGTAGGAKITITGSGFQEGAVAYFGSQISKESILESETSLRVVVPMTEESGSVPVTVVNPDGGQFTLEGAFTYINSENGDNAQVFGVSPLVIIEEANTEITLRGRNLIIAYKDGLVALRCPSRVNIEISSVVQNEADENGIESLVFKATVTATPPLLPLERIAIQILASRRPKARDDLMVESSTQMFTVIPRDIPVPLAFTPSLSSDNPTMVVVLGENLEGCTLEFDSGTQTHVQMCDSHSLMGITTVTENMASGQSTMVSVLDKNGASVGQYSLSIAPSSELKKSDPIPPNDNSLFSGEGGIIETMPPPPANFTLDIVPIPNQKVLGPTEKDNLIFDLRGESQTNAVANAFNYTIQVYSYTIHFRIINRVYLFPLFDGGGSEFNSPILAKVGELFPVRGAGILVAFRLDIYLTVTVYIIIGINFDIPWFGYFNEFPQQFPNAIGIVIVGVRIEIDIYILASFMAALVLPDGRLQIIFLVVLIADFHFTISSDLHRLSFLPHFTHEVHHAGIFSGNNPLPCGGRFQLADDNGQTMFQDAHGGHLSYYFARSTGECCMPWRFNLELLQISSTNEEIVVQPPFDVNLCLNALESGEQIKVVIESVPPPTGNPETLVMNIADTAVLRALSVPVDQNGNPTGPGQDITELGYGVEFYLDQPLEVLSQGQLPDGVAIAIQEGSNIIRAAVTSVRILDDEQFLSFWQGSILGFDIIRFLAEGQPPRLRTGSLPVTVNPNAGAIKITPTLAYKENGQLVEVQNNELIRYEPFETQRDYVLALKMEVPRSARLPQTLIVKVLRAEIKVVKGGNEKSLPPLRLDNPNYPDYQFNDERASETRSQIFFTGNLAIDGTEQTITIRPTSQGTFLKEVTNMTVMPNNKEVIDANGILRKLVPPGKKVLDRNVQLSVSLKITSSVSSGISVNQSKIKMIVVNEETFEEYLRVFDEAQKLLTLISVPSDNLRKFAENFYNNDLFTLSSPPSNSLLISKGKELWNKSVDFVKTTAKDDRILYYLRLLSVAALRAHYKRNLFVDLPNDKLKMFEWSSRGLETSDGVNAKITFSPSILRQAIITGYDPFILAQVPNKSNPSGLLALALNNEKLGDIQAQVDVKTAIMPVRYKDFDDKLIEKIIESSLESVVMILTTSQHLAKFYDAERFASKKREPNVPDNSYMILREYQNPIGVGETEEEFLESTLPYQFAIRSDNYAQLIFEGPTGNSPFVIDQSYWVDGFPQIVALGKFQDHPNFGDLDSYTKLNDKPLANKVLNSGSGGGFLSNEIFFRVALIRKRDRPKLASGHLHIPPTGTEPRTKGQDLITGSTKAINQLLKYSFLLSAEGKWDIQFPDTQINTNRGSITRIVTNTTNSAIKVVSVIWINQGPFSVQLPQALPVIGPQESIPLVFTFEPTSVQDFAGKLLLKDERGEIVFVITLEGKALLTPPPPQIMLFTPSSGFDGTFVTISGTDFVEVQDVQLGNQGVGYTVDNSTQITVEATPPGGFFTIQTAYGSVTSNTRFIVRRRAT